MHVNFLAVTLSCSYVNITNRGKWGTLYTASLYHFLQHSLLQKMDGHPVSNYFQSKSL